MAKLTWESRPLLPPPLLHPSRRGLVSTCSALDALPGVGTEDKLGPLPSWGFRSGGDTESAWVRAVDDTRGYYPGRVGCWGGGRRQAGMAAKNLRLNLDSCSA